MEEIKELFKTILGPATIGFAIICLINWFKMFPGADDEKLSPLWPGVAAILGASLLSLYAWIFFGITGAKDVAVIVVVGAFLGFATAGLYKLGGKLTNDI